MPEPDYQNRIELLQGTLDVDSANLARGPQHCYGVSNAIRANSGDLLRVETGSLFPALHRLARKGWIKAEWNQSEADGGLGFTG